MKRRKGLRCINCQIRKQTWESRWRAGGRRQRQRWSAAMAWPQARAPVPPLPSLPAPDACQTFAFAGAPAWPASHIPAWGLSCGGGPRASAILAPKGPGRSPPHTSAHGAPLPLVPFEPVPKSVETPMLSPPGSAAGCLHSGQDHQRLPPFSPRTAAGRGSPGPGNRHLSSLTAWMKASRRDWGTTLCSPTALWSTAIQPCLER